MRDAEMILRFFAFHYNAKNYRGFYAPFLDKYLEVGMHFDDDSIGAHEALFEQTIAKVNTIFGENAFRQIDDQGRPANQVNRAIYDIIMLSFAHLDLEALKAKMHEILLMLQELCVRNTEFKDAIGRATRDKARINKRMELWGNGLRALGLPCPKFSYGEPDNAVAGVS